MLTTLNVAVSAADAATSALAADNGLSAIEATAIQSYLGQVSTGLSYAATELASTDSATVKTEKIAGKFAEIAVLDGPLVAAAPYVQAVLSGVTAFLAEIHAGSGTLASRASDAMALNSSARSRLDSMRKHADLVAARLAATPRR